MGLGEKREVESSQEMRCVGIRLWGTLNSKLRGLPFSICNGEPVNIHKERNNIFNSMFQKENSANGMDEDEDDKKTT